jgi:protein-ribulosamine 3-kinase
MMEGEFNAMTELYKTMPSLVPRPYAWGKFKLPTLDTYFFLCDFIDMSNRLPDPVRLCSRIAELHRTSVSPTGKFGFHVPTCHGRFPQYVDWDSNWASFFTKLLADALRLDLQTNGPWPEFERVSERILTRVIPRLLGVLQEDGRDIKPCLIHGDLWEGNIGTAYDNNEVYIFDSGAYYAHNEMEIGMWRCVRHRINAKIFTRQYLREFPISEPTEEWDDRNRIYCVKMNIIHAAHHKGDIVRQT